MKNEALASINLLLADKKRMDLALLVESKQLTDAWLKVIEKTTDSSKVIAALYVKADNNHPEKENLSTRLDIAVANGNEVTRAFNRYCDGVRVIYPDFPSADLDTVTREEVIAQIEPQL